MITANSKNNCLIRLTDERIKHIIRNHPETKECLSWILEAIENPDMILAGDYGELLAIKLHSKTPVTFDKYLTVVYKEASDLDGFILTAYFSRIFNKTRKVIWRP